MGMDALPGKNQYTDQRGRISILRPPAGKSTLPSTGSVRACAAHPERAPGQRRMEAMRAVFATALTHCAAFRATAGAL